MIMRLLGSTAGPALCLCPILWLLDFEDGVKLAWEIFKLAGCLLFLWPFASAFIPDGSWHKVLTIALIVFWVRQCRDAASNWFWRKLYPCLEDRPADEPAPAAAGAGSMASE